ncbi:glycosyltransferase [Candidatus Nitrosotalea okcheonensis]|uniref:glycosyltransferase n=1 Tax=Candidatus Nitrosotalea okcheonensis TaxID=1903276 RepID=UPI0013904580|nr:glycosyltransferase [Candidatus Nitrosotalea okcheonensis]
MNHEIVIIVRKDSSNNHQDNVHAILPSPMKAFFILPLIIIKLSTIIKKENPDVIVVEGGWYIPLLISMANITKRKPIIFVFRGLVLETLVAFHAKSFLIKTVARLFIKINHAIYKKSKFLIGTNPSLCKFYEEKLRKKVTLIGTHSIDFEIFKPLDAISSKQIREQYGIDKNKISILYSGAIEEWHISYLVDLIDNVVQLDKEGHMVQIIIMGWGSCRDKLLNLIKKKIENGVKKDVILAMPWLEHQIVPKIIASCDICVDPFLRPHPMNYAPAGKLMEYMACGKCIITTKGYSNEELVTDKKSGFIVDGTKTNLYLTLKNILIDKDNIKGMGQIARETIVKLYSSTNKIEDFEEYLKKASMTNHPTKKITDKK